MTEHLLRRKDAGQSRDAFSAVTGDDAHRIDGVIFVVVTVTEQWNRAGVLERRVLSAPPAPIRGLTPRQRQVMDMVLAGQPSKNIAADLNISRRTVENHRAAIMKRTGATSLPALARLVFCASLQGAVAAVA